MKKFGKIMVIVLALATLVGACFAFAACNDKDNDGKLIVATNCEFDPFEYLDANGNPTGIDIDIAYALGEIVATNCEFDPFEYLDANGNPTGIDIDIAYALGEKLGLEVEIRDMAFESVVASVSSGTCDIAMAGLTVTAERMEAVNFTQTYFSSSQVVIAPANDPISVERNLS